VAVPPNFEIKNNRIPILFEICFDPSVPVVGVTEFVAVMIAERGICGYLASITFYAIIATGYSERSVRCSISGKASETVRIFVESALASRNLL
jgi:hypothetical protein